jgi:transcriptional regulator with XRE-family HTH domain
MMTQENQNPVRAYRLNQTPPLKQEVLADRIGTTKANLSRIETGKQTVSEALLPKLVAETGIPARVLRPDLAKLFATPRARRGPGRPNAPARAKSRAA